VTDKEWLRAVCDAGWRANVAGAFVVSAVTGWPFWVALVILMAVLMLITWFAVTEPGGRG
jgi:hypothetical protein